MRLVILAFAGLILAFVVVACDGGEPQRADRSADTIVRDALIVMEGLDSYRLEMLFGAGEAPPVVIEFAAPNNYRFLLSSVVGAANDREEVGGLYEAILAGDRAYVRRCEDIDEGCGPWEEGPRSPVATAGPSPSFLPGWPPVALEMARDLTVAGTEERDGASTVRLRGVVNPIRAILENERRAFTAAGITTFGEECEAGPGEAEECRELTFEESLERQEPTLSFYDVNPATVEAWVGRKDSLIRGMRLTVPPHEESGEVAATIDIEYSRFDEVSISAPD